MDEACVSMSLACVSMSFACVSMSLACVNMGLACVSMVEAWVNATAAGGLGCMRVATRAQARWLYYWFGDGGRMREVVSRFVHRCHSETPEPCVSSQYVNGVLPGVARVCVHFVPS